MKKWMSLLLAAAMTMSLLAGCAGSNAGSADSTDATAGTETTETARHRNRGYCRCFR